MSFGILEKRVDLAVCERIIHDAIDLPVAISIQRFFRGDQQRAVAASQQGATGRRLSGSPSGCTKRSPDISATPAEVPTHRLPPAACARLVTEFDGSPSVVVNVFATFPSRNRFKPFAVPIQILHPGAVGQGQNLVAGHSLFGGQRGKPLSVESRQSCVQGTHPDGARLVLAQRPDIVAGQSLAN